MSARLQFEAGIARTACVPLRRMDDMLELMYRALGPAGREESGITTESLAIALERSAERGLLLDTEASLLAGVLELEEVRVREVMADLKSARESDLAMLSVMLRELRVLV